MRHGSVVILTFAFYAVSIARAPVAVSQTSSQPISDLQYSCNRLGPEIQDPRQTR